MMDKDKIIIQRDIHRYDIKKGFISRKNEVYLVDVEKTSGQILPCVLKKYSNPNKSKSKEAFLLKVLGQRGLDVPKIYFEGDDYLLLEYIDGETFLDVVTNLEKSQGENIHYTKNYMVLFQLFKWLQNLQRITKETLGKSYIFMDINFRNFILKDKIYGVDLEDCSCKGYKEIDGGKFCAYLLTYNPSFTPWKKAVIKQALDIMTIEFGYNREVLEKETKRELSKIQNRRNMEIPLNISEVFFPRK